MQLIMGELLKIRMECANCPLCVHPVLLLDFLKYQTDLARSKRTIHSQHHRECIVAAGISSRSQRQKLSHFVK